jgi:putative membrane protein
MNQENKGWSRNWILVPALILISAIAVLVIVSFYYVRPASAFGEYPFYGWFPFGWFFFVPVVFLIFFVFRWVLWGGWGWGRYYDDDRALVVLKERFARGELSEEQFEQMTKELEKY